MTGHFQFLRATVKFLAPTSVAGATGWDGTTGWRAFLEWAREGNVFRFYPDKNTLGTFVDCYLIEPMFDGGSLLDDFTRELPVLFRSDDGTPFTGF